MARKLEVDHDKQDGEDRIAIRGQLDERADLGELAESLGDRVRIDLSELSFVNSLGLRAWIRMLLRLSDREADVVLTRCSEAMVHQMSMVVAAKAGARVESFYCPYECPSCGHAASICLDVGEHRGALEEMTIPDQPCPECAIEMQCSEIPERYLLFLEL